MLRGDIEGLVRRARELVAAVRNKQIPVERLVIARTVRPEGDTTSRPGKASPSCGCSSSCRPKGTM